MQPPRWRTDDREVGDLPEPASPRRAPRRERQEPRASEAACLTLLLNAARVSRPLLEGRTREGSVSRTQPSCRSFGCSSGDDRWSVARGPRSATIGDAGNDQRGRAPRRQSFRPARREDAGTAPSARGAVVESCLHWYGRSPVCTSSIRRVDVNPPMADSSMISAISNTAAVGSVCGTL